jgi:hypothetical protein
VVEHLIGARQNWFGCGCDDCTDFWGLSMADDIDRAIQAGCEKVDGLAAELLRAKLSVNGFCELLGKAPVYQDVSQPETSRTASHGRPDRYHGKPLATVLKQILSARNAAGIGPGPATVDDLYAEMRGGSFDFGDKSDEDAKRGLAVSLAKNSKMFYRVKDGLWGLPEWYGIKPSRGSQKPSASAAAPTDDEPDPEEKAREFGEPDGADTAPGISLLPVKG